MINFTENLLSFVFYSRQIIVLPHCLRVRCTGASSEQKKAKVAKIFATAVRPFAQLGIGKINLTNSQTAKSVLHCRHRHISHRKADSLGISDHKHNVVVGGKVNYGFVVCQSWINSYFFAIDIKGEHNSASIKIICWLNYTPFKLLKQSYQSRKFSLRLFCIRLLFEIYAAFANAVIYAAAHLAYNNSR